MKFGCCVSIQNYDLVLQSGFDCISPGAKEIAAMDDAAFGRCVETISAGSLQCEDLNAYCPPSLHLDGPDFQLDAVQAYAKKLMPRAQTLGIQRIGIGSPFSRNIPEGYDRKLAMRQLCDSFAATCDIAARHGITTLIESVCELECNFITTTEQALELLAQVNRKNLALVYDIYHTYMMREELSWIAQAAPHIQLVHISQEDHLERLYLREANMPEYKLYFDALRAVGYDGCVSLEAFCGDLETELPRSLRILKQL